MGNVQLLKLKKYWIDSERKVPSKDTLRKENDEKFVEIFNYYDKGNNGFLGRDEAMNYINDLLRISGLKKKIYLEAEQANLDKEKYYQKYVENIFSEMDLNKNGKIEKSEIYRPKSSVWNDILLFISSRTLHEHAREESKSEQIESPTVLTKASNNGRKLASKGKSPTIDRITSSHKRAKGDAKRSGSERSSHKSDKSKSKSASKSDKSGDKEKPKSPKKVTKRRHREIEEAFGDDEGEDNGTPMNIKITEKVLTSSGIIAVRTNTVKEVVDMLQIPPHIAQNLLHHYHWDSTKLLAAYFDNPEETCRAAGIEPSSIKIPDTIEQKNNDVEPEEKKRELKNSNEENENTKQELPRQIECSVCLDDTEDYTVLDACGHYFCNECWGGDLSVQIGDGKTLEIHCMHAGCNELVPDNIVKKVVNEETWKKYVSFLSKKFVENNKEVRWCPAPGCTKAITESIAIGPNLVGRCTCGYSFCWRCGRVNHSPATCDQMSKFEEMRGSEELQNKKWLRENTKSCPKCKSSIEKNDGCFQMQCNKCRYRFCWFCLSDWATHGDHFKCSKYKVGSDKLENRPQHHDKLESKDNELRVLKLIERYNSYDAAKKNADSLHFSLYNTVDDMKMQDEIFDSDIIYKAEKQLDTCRTIIQYMCVAQAIVDKPKEAHHIAAQQETLEAITEKLAQTLEKDFIQAKQSSEDSKIPSFIRRQTKVAEQFIANLEQETDILD